MTTRAANEEPAVHPVQMARWRLRLFAWLTRREAPEALTLGLPPARVVTIEQVVEPE